MWKKSTKLYKVSLEGGEHKTKVNWGGGEHETKVKEHHAEAK